MISSDDHNAVAAPSSLHRVLLLITEAFESLGKKVAPAAVERIGTLIHEVMTAPRRKYHSIEHVFKFGDDLSPLETLAVLTHDLVYWQIDRVQHPILRELIKPYVFNDTGNIVAQGDTICHGRGFRSMVCAVFGVTAGQVLGQMTGANEFSSAYAAEALFADILAPREIQHIVICIEATRPFRKPDPQGRGPVDLLNTRLLEANRELGWKLSESDLGGIIASAVKVAHRDVAGFAADDTSIFLRDSWDILSESDPTFEQETYRASDFRQALQRMEGFVSSLDPDLVFASSTEGACTKSHQEAVAAVKRNLKVGAEYIQAKLLSIGVIEALGELSGASAPLLLFTGSVHPTSGQGTLEELLRKLPTSGGTGAGRLPDVQRLLDGGRGGSAAFDRDKSPVGSFIYARLSGPQFDQSVASAKAYFSKKITADEFVCGTMAECIKALIPVFATLAWTRSTELRAIGQHISMATRPSMA